MIEPVLSSQNVPETASSRQAHVIVLGNEKGGSGKTTSGMHLIIALLRLGFSVGSIDIDSRQRSLSRYLENRRQTMLKEGVNLPQPQHIVVQKSPYNVVQEAEEAWIAARVAEGASVDGLYPLDATWRARYERES